MTDSSAVSTPNTVSSELLVSVLIPTYNHSHYIDRTLETVFEQQTSFNFEVIVRDDASTDGTQEKLMNFQALYPETLRVLYNGSNAGSRHFFTDVLPLARGQLLAYCDGDDYWLDSKKLEKQVTQLLHSPTLSCVATDVMYEYNAGLHDSHFKRKSQLFKSGDWCALDNLVTSSLVFRRFAALETQAFLAAPFGDVLLKTLLLMEGDILYDGTFVSAVHRIHSQGEYNGRPLFERDQLTLFSRIVAAREAAIAYGRIETAELVGIAVRDYCRSLDRETAIRSLSSVHRQTGLTTQWWNWIRRHFVNHRK